MCANPGARPDLGRYLDRLYLSESPKQIQSLSQKLDQITHGQQKSALVHICEGLWVDAGAIVSVEVEASSVMVVWKGALVDGNNANSRIFPCPDYVAAHVLAAAIKHRVNRGLNPGQFFLGVDPAGPGGDYTAVFARIPPRTEDERQKLHQEAAAEMGRGLAIGNATARRPGHCKHDKTICKECNDAATSPQVGNMYVCEKCAHRFERDMLRVGLECPACGTEFVRKLRESDLASVTIVESANVLNLACSAPAASIAKYNADTVPGAATCLCTSLLHGHESGCPVSNQGPSP